MTHVLLVPSFYPYVGNPVAGIFFREQAVALTKRGLKVGVVHPDQRSLLWAGRRDLIGNLYRLRVADDAGIATYSSTFPAIPKLTRAQNAMWLQQLRRLVKRYVTQHGVPDLLHAHGILWAGVGAVEAGRALSTPVVITAHSSGFARGLIRSREAVSIREAMQGAAAVLAVSGALRSHITAYAPDVTIEVLPNLVDSDFFTLADRQRKEEFSWLTIASLTEKKRIDTMLRAFAEGSKRQPLARLRIAGDGPERRRLEGLSERLGISDRVAFLGRLSREEIRSELHAADAFVLASPHETFGVVLIEALATGLPVVTTKSGGPEDFVVPEVGCLVGPEPSDLADGMVGIHTRREEWHGRAESIRSYAIENFGERAVTDRIIQVYERVLVRDS